jgi:hypothetical protein
MPGRRRFCALATVSLLSILILTGCGNAAASQESQWRRDADSSLKEMKAATSYHYSLNIENWVSVSGQSIYGNEKGEGSFSDGNYQIQLLQQSPSGDVNIGLLGYGGKTYLNEGEGWREIKQDESPAPLCDPRRYLEIISGYDSIELEGDDQRAGISCERYLIKIGSDKAKQAFSALGWSYFSQLRFEVSCRIWIADSSQPPLALQLEVVGFDAEESLQRCRTLATLDLYDLGSPQIEVTLPEGLGK